MQLSPLQLMECSFEGVSITPVEGFDNAKRDPSLAFTSDGMKLQSEAGISVLKEGEKHSDYGLRFTLIVGAKEGSAVPYDIRVSVAGGVRLYGGGTQEQFALFQKDGRRVEIGEIGRPNKPLRFFAGQRPCFTIVVNQGAFHAVFHDLLSHDCWTSSTK